MPLYGMKALPHIVKAPKIQMVYYSGGHCENIGGVQGKVFV
jgi:hypothetical protein